MERPPICARKWVGQRILRRQPPPTTVQIKAVSSASLTSTARTKVRPVDLPSTASSWERLDRVERYLEHLDSDIEGIRTELQDGINRVSGKLSAEIDRVSDRLNAAVDDVRSLQNLTVGPGGRGL